MMAHDMKTAAFAALAMALAASLPAAASGKTCKVKDTLDGYVPVREHPNPRGERVAKARPGHIVEVLVGPGGQPRVSGRWWRVRHFPGKTMPDKAAPAFKSVHEGWINSRLIEGCS